MSYLYTFIFVRQFMSCHIKKFDGKFYKLYRLMGKQPEKNPFTDAVPTNDIHMWMLGLDDEWVTILNTYIKDVAGALYDGYNEDGSIVSPTVTQRDV